ncbi:MAG: clostripain-related cysteine peptidase [Elusimicrobiales bacterium]
MRKVITAIMALSLAGGAYASEHARKTPAVQVDFDRGVDVKTILSDSDFQTVEVTAPEKIEASADHNSNPAVKEWTVMVYMNGKNDLERYALRNLNEMELVGSNQSVNMVAEIGRMNGQKDDSHNDGDWTGSRRYYITQDSDRNRVASEVAQFIPNADMGDWRHLVDFAKWARKNYPARRYALIIWNHGTGWVTDKRLKTGKGISYDDETKNHISTPELGAAMRTIGKVDILAYDACLMQMAELIYEVNGYADYVVGSEEIIWGSGLHYSVILKAFAKSYTSEEVVCAMGRVYYDFYSAKDREKTTKATLSAVRMSALDEFVSAFNAWTEALLASSKGLQIKRKIYSARAYTTNDNKDLYDVARLAAEADPQGAVAEKGLAMMRVIKDKLIVSHFSTGPDADHGLAIYLPANRYNENYDQLAWAHATRWARFLKKLNAVPVPAMVVVKGCIYPGPGASTEQQAEYIVCVLNASPN